MPPWIARLLNPTPPPAQAAPQPAVTTPVNPGVSMLSLVQLVIAAIALVAFLLWWGKSEPAQEPAKKNTSSVSLSPPDKGLFGPRVKMDEARANLERQARELEESRRRAEQAAVSQGAAIGGSMQSAAERAAEERLQEAKAERNRLWMARFSPGLVTVPDVSMPAPVSGSPAPSPSAGHSQASPDPAAATDQPAPAPPVNTATAHRDCVDRIEAGRQLYAVCQGTFLQARTRVRLNGEAVGPVSAMLEQDVYARDHVHLLLPAGTTLIGEAAKVSQQFQQRLNVSFSRILLPNGDGYALDGAPALQRDGEVGLKDKVNNHLPSTIATAVAMGGLAAFSTSGTGGVLTVSGLDMYRQGVSSQIGQAGQQVVGPRLNRPPSLTITEGFAVEVWLREDLLVPEYAGPTVVTSFGGRR